MADLPTTHLSDEQLARFQDGDATPAESSHLHQCPECLARLRSLETAAAAWAEYRLTVLDPALPPPPRPWRSLESLIREKQPRRRHWSWWAVPALAAAACLLVTVALVSRRAAPPPAADAADLLARAVLYERPSHGTLTLRMNGRTLARPEVLLAGLGRERNPELARLAHLFARAEYDWTQPLSARAFLAWRNALRHRRDTVSVVDRTGSNPVYRVQTVAPGAALESASLTLRGRTLSATDATFQFQGEALLEMGLGEGTPEPAAPNRAEAPTETPATPADTLRVLAALNAIDADAGEPLELTNDAAGQLLVRGAGLDADRREQVAAALRPLAHVRLDLNSASAASLPNPRAAAVRSTNAMPEPLRRQLEDRLGGPGALQDVTDRVLEASAQAVARVHAVQVLATHFPPAVESALTPDDRALLHTLLHRHLTRLAELTAQIRAGLKPVLASAPPSPAPPAGPWQQQSAALVAAVQALDASLNQLLAGPSEPTLLRRLPDQLARLDQLAATLQQGGR